MSKVKSQKSKAAFFQGFTLIEMIVVFAITGVLVAGGVSSFFSYSRNQEFRSTVSGIAHVLDFLRSRSLSQVKPPECAGERLDGYEFLLDGSGTSYTSRVRCGGEYYDLETKQLPSDITFDAASDDAIFFLVSSGTVDSAKTIILTGRGNTSTITIQTTGVVSVQ